MNKGLLLLMAIILMSIAIIHSYIAIQGVRHNQEELTELVNAQKNGKRKDPFRCSDGKKYFSQVGVYVDCVAIEKEVNGD